MNRRELLGAVGLGATGLAGFVGARAGGAGQETETATETTTTAEGGESAGIESAAERPFATVSVGSREGIPNPDNNLPHAVRVWNASEQSRTIGLTLVRAGGGDSPVMDRQVEFPADGYLALRLLEPASYVLTVSPGDEAGGTTANATTDGGAAGAATTATATAESEGRTVRIPRAQFDCNDSRTDVTVAADGRVRSETVTTEQGCPPEVVDRTFTALGGSCGADDDASVSFGEESVEVAGAIRAPNPCYGARLAEVGVASGDALRVVVATAEPSAGVCAQCVASVEYRADLAFRDRAPDTVEVVHRHDGETRTVATVARGGGSADSGTETTASGTAATGTTTSTTDTETGE